MAESFEVKGLKELEAALDALPANVERNVARGALRAGANVLRDEARRLAPVKSGLLQKFIRVVQRRGAPGRLMVNVVAGGSGAGKPWYARFLEYGTAPHRIEAKKGGALFIGGHFVKGLDHPGAAPHPFMRPALDTKAKDAVEAFRKYVAERLDKLKG